MSHPACMGGWCTKRDKCFYYHNDEPSSLHERLCESNEYDAFKQVVFITREEEPQEESCPT